MPTTTSPTRDWNARDALHDSGFRFPDESQIRLGSMQEEIEKLRSVIQSMQSQRDIAMEEVIQKTNKNIESSEEIHRLHTGMIKLLRISGIVLNLKQVERGCPEWREHIRYFCETLMNRAKWVNIEKYLTSDKDIDRVIGQIMWDNTKDKLAMPPKV